MQMPVEMHIHKSRSVVGVFAFALSLVLVFVGIGAAQFAIIGYPIFALGILAASWSGLGLVLPAETGCSVDDQEIRWWTTRPNKSQTIRLSDIDNVKRISLDSSWIEITTHDRTTYSISDAYTGETDRIFKSLIGRIKTN